MKRGTTSRRRFLGLVTLGGASSLLVACTNQPATAVPPTQAATVPSPAPTLAPATALPTVAPTAAAVPTLAPTAVTAPTTAANTPTRAVAMAQAATNFLAGLNDDQRNRASFAFSDAERSNWHWVPRARNGVVWGDLNPEQRELATQLLRSGLSDAGVTKIFNIITLQEAEVRRSSDLYYLTIFDQPDANGVWGWRFEGNHISVNTTSVRGQLAQTPLFFGVVPTEGRSGSFAGVRLMDREEQAARELLNSLNNTDRAAAVFQERSLTNLATGNAPQARSLDPVGIPISGFTPDQRGLVSEIVNAYLGSMDPAMEAAQRALVEGSNPAEVRFGWAGSSEANQSHYYRLQGPRFLLEFDNSRDSGRHIHSVWRDLSSDFGVNLI